MTGDDQEIDSEEAEIGREVTRRTDELASVLGDFYRGEIDRTTTWRQRMDESTKWAVTIIAALLVYGFSAQGTPEVLLAGVVVTMVFLSIEARRYQDYDVFRARVRLLQENLFADVLDPTEGVDRRDWRRRLGDDLRNPAVKIPYAEAFARRSRRVYFWLLLTLLAAWLFRVVTFAEGGSWLSVAAVGVVPGAVVAGTVLVFGLAIAWITFRPRPRRAKGEFERDEAIGAWKDEK